MSKEKRKLKLAAQDRIAREIKEDDRCKAYFEPYTEETVEKFIRAYAEVKAAIEVDGQFTKYRQENSINYHYEGAWDALKDIQYKKLFDVECQWRAEQVRDLPDVSATWDFLRIAKNILAYDGIPPVSETDVQLYQQFLGQKRTQIEYYLDSADYPDCEELKDRYRKHSETEIDYFDFHNNRTGNHGLLLLPDLRSAKEEKYLKAYGKHNSSKSTSKTTKKQTPTDQKKRLFSFNEELIEFGEHIGDKKTINFIRDQWKWAVAKPDEIIDWAFYYLIDVAPEEVNIEANDDWKEGLYFAAIHHRNSKIIELLPSIHDQYLMKKEMGFFAPKEKVPPERDVSEILKKYVLDGREALGEPRDFNF